MTDYEPYPTVEIDGASFDPEYALSSVRISSGRKDVLNQPEPSYASIELWTDANNPLDVELSDSLKVFIPSGSGSIRPDRSNGGGNTFILNGIVDAESARRTIERVMQNSTLRTGAVNLAGSPL